MGGPQGRWILVAVIIGSGMVFLDSTVVTVALNRIGEDLPSARFGVLEAQAYVYSGYLLTLSAFLVLAGALNDAWGRRRMFIAGLAAFAVSSALCGLAPTMEWLIAGRLLQGAAGALLVPGSLSIISATFDEQDRSRAFGIWASASGLTTIVGPPLGGLLVDTVSWRAVFFLNLPLAAVAVWACARHLEESRDIAGRRVDWLGALVAVVALGGLTLGSIRGQAQQWQGRGALLALGVGGLAAVVFPALMARRRDPLVPLDLFRSRNFSVTNLSTVLIYGGLYVVSYLTVIFLQGTLGYTATAAALAMVVSSVFLTLLSPLVGRLAARHGVRRFMAAGPGVMALGVAWLARIPADSAAWTADLGNPASLLPPAGYARDVLPAVLLFGVGLAVVVAPLTTALMNSVPTERSGVGSAVNNALSRVGPQLATALIFVAMTATFYATLGERAPDLQPSDPGVRSVFAPLNAPAADVTESQQQASREASTTAYRLAMGIAAAMMAVGGLVNGVGIRDDLGRPPRARGPGGQSSSETA